MTGGHAVHEAVRAFVSPNSVRNLAAGPLPSHVFKVIKLAARSDEALEEWSVELNLPKERLVDIARFFLEQVLMTRDATHYRVLGVEPFASSARIRAHYRWLMKWLHPDKTNAGWHAVLAERVNRAYAELRDPQRRADYDASLKLRSRSRFRTVVPLPAGFTARVAASEQRQPDAGFELGRETVAETFVDPVSGPLLEPETESGVPAAVPVIEPTAHRESDPALVEPPRPWIPPPRPWVPPPRRPPWLVPAVVAGALLVLVLVIVVVASLREEEPAWPVAAAPEAAATGPVQPAATANDAVPAEESRAREVSEPPAPVQQASAPVITSTGSPVPTPARSPAPSAASSPSATVTRPAVSERSVATITPAPATAPSRTETAAPAPARTETAIPAPPVAPEARALAARVGAAYAAGDFLTVLNLASSGGQLTPPELAATAQDVQRWGRDRAGLPLAVTAAQPLPADGEGTSERAAIELRSTDSVGLRVVVRRDGETWKVERLAPIAAPAGVAESGS